MYGDNQLPSEKKVETMTSEQAEKVVRCPTTTVAEPTQGTWHAALRDFGFANGRSYIGVDNGQTSIAWVLTNSSTFPYQELPYEANARVLAAAPEMLAACKDALEAICWYGAQNFENERCQRIEDQLASAISKAEGK
jgi:hypothetical protein